MEAAIGVGPVIRASADIAAATMRVRDRKHAAAAIHAPTKVSMARYSIWYSRADLDQAQVLTLLCCFRSVGPIHHGGDGKAVA